MGQITVRTRAAGEDIKAKLQEHAYVYRRIQGGDTLTVNECVSVPSLHEIMKRNAELFPKKRVEIDYSELRAHDLVLQEALFTRLMQEVAAAKTAEGISLAYANVVRTIQRFGSTPAAFVKSIQADGQQTSVMRFLFGRAATTHAREQLNQIFTRSALFADDVAILRNERAPANDRLNALLRPIHPKLALSLLTILEEALAAEGEGRELEDCVADIIPTNLHLNEPDDPLQVPVDPKYIPVRVAVTQGIQNIGMALDHKSLAKAYSGILDALRQHRMTVERYLEIQPFPQARESTLASLQKGALAYVFVGLTDLMLKKEYHPGAENMKIAVDPAVRSIDQLNALFCNTGLPGNKLLTVLEEAGFDLEEDGLIDRLLAVGKKPEVAAFPAQQLG